MPYTLYNKQLDHYLVHPQVGLWHTDDLAEAQEMLVACREYVDSFNSGGYEKEFVIVDVETGKEICLESPPPEKA